MLISMKKRSIMLALAASAFAATVLASLIMPPIADAQEPTEPQRRCEGYQRMAVLMRSTANAQNFSMADCRRSLETFSPRHGAQHR